MSTFDTLFEEQIGQFTQHGPIAGDYVKIKGDHKASEWYKTLDESKQNYVKEILTLVEQGKYLMLSTIKSAKYEVAQKAPSTREGTAGTAWDIADIVVEVNPGFFSHTLTLPLALLEFDMSWDEARATRPVKGEQSEVELKPKDVEDAAIDVGQQTQVPDGDYTLGTANYMP
tara:strand:+ start:6746 stop:7261 length:516 start_codon:yes stop_codon:yes gene_type:complete